MDTQARIRYPYIDEALLNSFKETNASKAFRCRYQHCARHYDGFESEEAHREHERCHMPRIMCTETACTYASQLGFKTAAELRRHIESYHQKDNESPLLITYHKIRPSYEQGELGIRTELNQNAVPHTTGTNFGYVDEEMRVQYGFDSHKQLLDFTAEFLSTDHKRKPQRQITNAPPIHPFFESVVSSWTERDPSWLPVEARDEDTASFSIDQTAFKDRNSSGTSMLYTSGPDFPKLRSIHSKDPLDPTMSTETGHGADMYIHPGFVDETAH